MKTSPPAHHLDIRKALGNFGTGVTVVTTLASDGRKVGVTANSFNSVSLEPFIVLWSLLRTSPSLAAFDHSGRFVVNVLSVDQVEVSRRFASPATNKFEGIEHHTGLAGLPILQGCASTFECVTTQRLDVGDHILFLGEVAQFQSQAKPTLIFCQGQYAQSLPLDLSTV
jgi:flavin reductase (DIM6/NTAB) family NADH-FMN oxidoreductase RutF